MTLRLDNKTDWLNLALHEIISYQKGKTSSTSMPFIASVCTNAGTEHEQGHRNIHVPKHIEQLFYHDNNPVSFLSPCTLLLYSKTGVYKSMHFCLFFALKHRLWVLTCTHNLYFEKKKKHDQRTNGPVNAHLTISQV